MIASVGAPRRRAALGTLLTLCLVAVRDANSRLSAGASQDVQMALNIKLAIFVDLSLESHLRDNLGLEGGQWDAFFRAYVRQIEANFSRFSSKSISSIGFELVDVIRRTRNSTLISTGDIDLLLDNFCQHQAEWRSQRAREWDLSLLLTANDLYSDEDKPEPQAITGISLLSGIHWPDLACLVVEFGVNYAASLDEDPSRLASSQKRVNLSNPTRGFASSWVAAHEIGHSLGLHHDGPPFNRECNSTDFMMSSTSCVQSMRKRWSSCSIRTLEGLDRALVDRLRAGKETSDSYEEPIPGKLFDLQEQCRAFAKDLQVSEKHVDESICRASVWCQNEQQLVAIGPALEGSRCDSANLKWCLEGECLLR